jgi:hypothetical protein
VDGSPKADEDHVTQDDAPLKRKASPVDDSSSTKRLRQDDDRSPPHRRPSVDTTQDRRASASQEEKKRGKRLFGGLLNTLSQTNTNSQHKRRQEIERRQQERMQKQLAKIKEARMVDQIDFEAQVVRFVIKVLAQGRRAGLLMLDRCGINTPRRWLWRTF